MKPKEMSRDEQIESILLQLEELVATPTARDMGITGEFSPTARPIQEGADDLPWNIKIRMEHKGEVLLYILRIRIGRRPDDSSVFDLWVPERLLSEQPGPDGCIMSNAALAQVFFDCISRQGGLRLHGVQLLSENK